MKMIHLVMKAMLILLKFEHEMLHMFTEIHLYLHFSYFFEIHRNFNTEANCEKVVYTHILSKGKTEEKHYGMLIT